MHELLIGMNSEGSDWPIGRHSRNSVRRIFKNHTSFPAEVWPRSRVIEEGLCLSVHIDPLYLNVFKCFLFYFVTPIRVCI
jgi:hypothetical protein